MHTLDPGFYGAKPREYKKPFKSNEVPCHDQSTATDKGTKEQPQDQPREATIPQPLEARSRQPRKNTGNSVHILLSLKYGIFLCVAPGDTCV